MTKIYLNKLSRFVCMAVVSVLFVSIPTDTFANNSDASLYQSSFDITGKVVDAGGNPIIGATAIVKNTTKGAITDLDGVFYINGVQATDSIVVSYVGYNTLTVQAAKTLNLTITEAALVGDEVVVVGFGTQKKVNVTGAVAMIGGEELEARPVKDVSSALQGVIPGLNISHGTGGGELDAEMSINIRGTGTIGDSDDAPLVLIDGIEGNMNTINPNDIQSISVLKDAASASVYGSRAAFGVILITTKSGKEGKAKINYTGNVRISRPTNLPNAVDSYTWASYINRASLNQGSSAIFSDAVMEKMLAYQNGDPDYQDGTVLNTDGVTYASSYSTGTYANTDWYETFYDQSVISHEHNISASGGANGITYNISGGYLNQEGLLNYGNESLQRYTLNARFTAKLTDWLDLTYNTKWTRRDFLQPTYLSYNNYVIYNQLNKLSPSIPLYNPDGNYNAGSQVIQLEDGGDKTDQTSYLTNQIQLVAEPVKGWRITAEAMMKTTNYFAQTQYLPVAQTGADGLSYDVYPYGTGVSQVVEGTNQSDFYTMNIFSDYTKSFNDHNFKIMGGFNSELYKYRNLSVTSNDLLSYDLVALNTALTLTNASGGYDHWSTAGFFGRLNYDYKGKYLFEANVRYDGTSRFIGDERWAVFPSFSAGWNIAKEKFFEPAADLFSTLKIRGSWGQLGNTNVSSYYPFYQAMDISTTNKWLIDGDYSTSASSPDMVTSSLTWETITNWNIGFDFAMLNNRLSGSFDYFERITTGMIGAAEELPNILGTDAPDVNNTDMKSYGWELELSWRDKIGDFSYGVKATLSDSQSKILKYANDTKNLNYYYDGMKIGEIWGLESIGIAQSQAEMDAHLASSTQSLSGGISGVTGSWTAGCMMYRDKDGDGDINAGNYTAYDHGDLTVIGNTTSRYIFGVTFDFAYKWFDMSMFFQGVGKKDYHAEKTSPDHFYWGACESAFQSMAYEEHMDFWRAEGDEWGANSDAYYTIPLFAQGNKNRAYQTAYLEDASYIRLKNLQIGYSLSQKNLDKIGISYLRVYFSADNLWTGTSLTSLYDPETLSGRRGNGKAYPLAQTFSFGVSVNF